LLEQAEKLNPNNRIILFNLGYYYYLLGDKQRASQQFLRCLSLSIKKKDNFISSKALFQIALICHEQQKSKDAESLYKKVHFKKKHSKHIRILYFVIFNIQFHNRVICDVIEIL
jgi:tetratricopeptide (TPR) repeat protein